MLTQYICSIVMLSALLFADTLKVNITNIQQTPIGSKSIAVYISVTDMDGRPIHDLTKEQFVLIEENQGVSNFQLRKASSEKDSVLYVLILDTSGSMRGDKMKAAKNALINFVEHTAPKDDIIIYSVDDKPSIICSLYTPKDMIKPSLKEVDVRGNYTVLHECYFKVIKDIQQINFPRKAIIILTDGKDEGSKVTIEDCFRQTEKSNIPTFTIGFGYDADRTILERIAMVTGGAFFFAPTTQDLPTVYRHILDIVAGQYVLSYSSLISAIGPKVINIVVKLDYLGHQLKDTHSFVATYSGSQNPLVPLLSMIGVIIICLCLFFVLKKMKLKSGK